MKINSHIYDAYLKRGLAVLFIGGAIICILFFLCAFQNEDVFSVSFNEPGKRFLPNSDYFIEAKTPCTVDLLITNDTIRKIKISSSRVSPAIITINAKLHTPEIRVTTEWNDIDSTTTLTARIPQGRIHHSLSFEIKDGPINDDKRFFTHCLNLVHPGLDKVKKAVESRDFKSARTYYVEYLKTRQSPSWFFNWQDFFEEKSRNAKYNTSTADRLASNILPSCNIDYDFGNTINWSINPTAPYYKEWTWQLSRHPYWMDLGKAYWATGDEKYAEAFVRQARSWITDNPRPDELYNKEYSRWRTLETGIRMRDAWIESFYRFLPSPNFDDETILMYVKSVYEHGEHLMLNHCEEGNNRFAMEMNGLYKVAVMFPEFKESVKWEAFAFQSLYEETERQFYPDGAQKELAPGYHGVALRSIITIVNLAKKNNKSLPEGLVGRLEKAYDYYLNIRMPNGSLPGVNDSDFSYDSDSQLRQGLGYFPDRKDYSYIVSNGEQGVEPSFKSTWMSWAGWYIMRSGWNRDALYSFFEVGPLAPGHFHEDKLSFILYGYGNGLLTEGGNYPYDTSDWRDYITSARAHNVTRIDGKNQHRGSKYKDKNVAYSHSPLSNRWISNGNFDFGEGWYDDGFGESQDSSVTQYRALLFIKNKYWIMFDMFFPRDTKEHIYETYFHLDAPDAKINEKFKSVTAINPGKAVLEIIPLKKQNMEIGLINGQRNPEIQGWVHDDSNGINTYNCRAVATPIFKRKTVGSWIEPYLLVPLKYNNETTVKKITSNSSNIQVELEDGSILTLNYMISDGKISSLIYTVKENNVVTTVRVI